MGSAPVPLRGERRLAEQQATRAGSQDVDESGRRIDDREFRETRDVLTLLGNSAIGHYRNRNSFRTDLVGGVYTIDDFTRRGLPTDHGVHMVISEDGRIAWFWRETIAGWNLAYAVSDNDRGMVEWFYSGHAEPVARQMTHPAGQSRSSGPLTGTNTQRNQLRVTDLGHASSHDPQQG